MILFKVNIKSEFIRLESETSNSCHFEKFVIEDLKLYLALRSKLRQSLQVIPTYPVTPMHLYPPSYTSALG
jgi:hypothetical protein